ncbi:MAG: hypothetical protein D6689_19865 [Deltaproteobacteria bacterium]|nr:MAG: hypothetical protein D6689_19865 [Deltaproteobacteria bacterium]
MRDFEQDSRLPIGHVELSARRGVAPDVDVGAKLFVAGAQVEATWRVVRGRWSWAVAPSLAAARTANTPATVDAIHAFAGVAGIASRPLSRRWSVSVGPLAGWGLFWPRTGGHAQGLWLGAFAGAEARLGARWRVAPELSVYRVVAGEVPIAGAAVQLGAAVRYDL